MKRLLLIILFGLIAFYIAWPAVSAWQIHGAIEGNDPATLANKVDFPGVRESMRPAVEGAVSDKIEDIKKSGDATTAVVVGLLQGGMLSKLTSVVLESIVTPENMIRLVGEKGTLPEKIERIIQEQLGQLGALGGAGSAGGGGAPVTEGNKIGGVDIGKVVKSLTPPTAEQNAAVQPAQGGQSREVPAIGLSNIKSFAFAGPLAFDIGVARDPGAAVADLTARMEFKDFDWKLSRVVPHLR